VEIVLEGEDVTFAVLDDLEAAVEKTCAAELDISFTDGSWVDDFAVEKFFPAISRNSTVTSLVFRRGLHAELAARLSKSIRQASGLRAITILHVDGEVDPAAVKAVADAAASKVGIPLNRFLFTVEGTIPEAIQTYAAALAKMRARCDGQEIFPSEEMYFGPPSPAMLKIDALIGAAMVDSFFVAHRKKTHDRDVPSIATKPYWLPRDYRRPNTGLVAPPILPAPHVGNKPRMTPLWLMDRVAVSLPTIGVLAEGDREEGAVLTRPIGLKLNVTTSPAW
jgi:hypothetical protein